ncbi:MAG: hypothetical protein J0I77_13815 [Rudaea sp.]|uniref:hypothetical protein n=1 Tax=unclassified Rudaea TaxID=2627037 RepID=UPI0014855B4D|nr:MULTISPECIES: hypothetical protein [unclassified Rudaea]MBN8886791.1 hypothetical protein [Rudaea sp.]
MLSRLAKQFMQTQLASRFGLIQVLDQHRISEWLLERGKSKSLQVSFSPKQTQSEKF